MKPGMGLFNNFNGLAKLRNYVYENVGAGINQLRNAISQSDATKFQNLFGARSGSAKAPRNFLFLSHVLLCVSRACTCCTCVNKVSTNLQLFSAILRAWRFHHPFRSYERVKCLFAEFGWRSHRICISRELMKLFRCVYTIAEQIQANQPD